MGIRFLNFTGYISHTLLWLRWGKCIRVFTNAPLTFSERTGYTKYKPLLFGWRLKTVA